MAEYQYVCGSCARYTDHTMDIGTAPRTSPCPECGSVMLLRIGVGVNISATALETKGVAVRAVDQKEAGWSKDMPAYRRMRHKGLQPEHVDGAASLEDKVGDQFDVKYQRLYDMGVSRERVQEGAEQAEQIMAEGVPR